jgi:hypothetical protein
LPIDLNAPGADVVKSAEQYLAAHSGSAPALVRRDR